MTKRFVSIWFRYLVTDWFALRQPAIATVPFVLSGSSHGRMVVTAANALAESQGVYSGLVLADARAIIPGLQVFDDKPGLAASLLKRIAEWCIRFTPYTAADIPDGIFLDASGCAHLWGNEEKYLTKIVKLLSARGYCVRAAMADTMGTAWAVARFGKQSNIINQGDCVNAISILPTIALRLEPDLIEQLHKLGIRQVKDLMGMPESALQRRFGNHILKRLHQALGFEEEMFVPVTIMEPYTERLPCMEPILTATGISIALENLLTALCKRLQHEGKGVRNACFKGYRIDGKMEQINIATSRASCNENHLYKLFEIKLQTIEPAMGIELFILEAPTVEDHTHTQEKLWETKGGLDDVRLSELIDRITGKIGPDCITRFLPNEHYWPERSIKSAGSLQEEPTTNWRTDKPRPIQLLPAPHHIYVTAPVPDYPPMNFRYKGKLHKIKKADGPERIEQEWWIKDGQHRDYYVVEDEEGCRYWLFRSGHYDEAYEWFIHGFFA